MAYPLVQLKPWRDFLSKLATYGVRIDESKRSFICNGVKTPLRYLERDVNGKTKRLPLRYSSPDELVTATVVRYVCKHLGIDPAEFGYILG